MPVKCGATQLGLNLEKWISNTGGCRAVGFQALLGGRQPRDTLKDAWGKKHEMEKLASFHLISKQYFSLL